MDAASEYERKRLENIKKNEEILLKLGLNAVAPCIHREVKRSLPSGTCTVHKSDSKQQTIGLESYLPKRRSARNREVKKSPSENAEILKNHEDACTIHMEAEEDAETLLDLDTWCKMNHIEPGPWVQGHYHGWVNEEVRQSLGIAASASEAWESNGGGKFSYRNPDGISKGKSTKKGNKTGSSAKEWARKMMYKNPNAYFYRHTCPGEEQKYGEWTEEEIELFVRVAKTYGSGDKWGLFASHIPHRVGYQCSAAYREIVIPRGLIRDPNFKMTRNGKAVYVGKYHH
ncbi:hypothetical protein GAYE_PCTG30G0688 [Galdieria yellowstonensis]|uniref:Myb-like domain-containing protein n=1 Tax=Galdieria yellowstonensis TaxID=3028027 RepID=A0AAV9I2Z3_9RHOD|nr:hypothetical protein GAYE_PCTG30G0688 [Galdieria yellowstonensis]